MKTKTRSKPGHLRTLIAATLLALTGLVAGAANAGEGRVPTAQYTDTGTDGCLTCHAGDNMTVMAETPHGDPDDPHTPYAQQGCESCHGPGSLHVSRSRGGAGFPALLRFRRDGDPVPDQLAACLNCHGEDMGETAGMAWTGSLHDTGRITCSTCHEMHVAENLLASRDQQIENCGMCHGKQIEEHNRFESRGIAFDRLDCAACHDVHQLMRRE